MPGLATQCGSLVGWLAALTRPVASSTRTALALQGRNTPGNRVQGLAKASVAHGEILSTCIKTAKGRVVRGGAPAHLAGFFKHRDAVARLHQRV